MARASKVLQGVTTVQRPQVHQHTQRASSSATTAVANYSHCPFVHLCLYKMLAAFFRLSYSRWQFGGNEEIAGGDQPCWSECWAVEGCN